MTEAQTSPRRRWLRLLAVVALIAGLLVIGRLTGWTDYLTIPRVRGFMEGAGLLGFLLFVVVFTLGELIHVPGVVFVAAAVLAYGQLVGGLASLAGAITSFTVSFVLIRAVGGRPLAEVKRPLVKKILARLETHPVTSVAALRFVLWMSPALNYALALTSVRFSHYVLGSVLGLLVPLVGIVVFFDWLFGRIL